MYLRRCSRKKSGKQHVYWELVESYRTESGPRQRVVSYLGSLSKPICEGIEIAAADRCISSQLQLFDEDLTPEWAQIDTRNVRVERTREFGGPWLALYLMNLLGLHRFFRDAFPATRATVCWQAMSAVLIACRLCSPSSELRIANCIYGRTALEDLLGLPCELVNDDRLYRSLDKLLEHKEALETHLKARMGELFDLTYDLLLYDVTSTFIEGEGADNEQMQRGYSRDQRSDCKQVCIALVVTRCGMPLGYEVFDGNRTDVTTVEDIVTLMETRYGKSDRIWVMDRGMTSEKNLEFLRKEKRRYILGASRAALKKFEKELLEDDWKTIRDGLDVKLCPSDDGKETFILCRSRDRGAKESAIHAKFEKRIEDALTKMEKTCQKLKIKPAIIERRVGALLSRNSRAKRLFQVQVNPRENGGCDVVWSKIEAHREWSELSEGCYMLRSNIADWTAEDLWNAYIQLTEAETAFRIHKSDLQLRPIWHQKKERVQAHILVCFLAYVLWKTFGQLCKRAGLGDEPRQIFNELSQIKMVDVVMQTKEGTKIRRRCIADPDKHQKLLLDMLRLRLPRQLRIHQNVVETFSSPPI
jgi:transposase